MDNLKRLAVAVTVAGLAAVGPCGQVLAEGGEQGWQPAPPMPDDFDWIQLTSGEWLKGEIVGMYKQSLEFESDGLDDLVLDWEDVRHVRTARVVQVAFLDDTISSGRLLVDGDDVRLMGGGGERADRSEILSITAGEPRERSYWSGRATAGLNLRSGNTEQREFHARASVKRRSPKSRVTVDYLGNFSETDGATIADDQRLNGSWGRFISDRFFVTPVYGEYYRDRFQNIAGRWSIGTGLGYDVVDTSRVDWSIGAGVAYQRTDFDDVTAGDPTSEDTPALMANTRYSNELTGWMEYTLDYRFSLVNEASGTYTHHLVTGFSFELFGDLDFDASLVWDRIQDPRRNADGTIPERDDFRTIFGLGYSF
jgi:putative salt-induced outer membrane protein YdiY